MKSKESLDEHKMIHLMLPYKTSPEIKIVIDSYASCDRQSRLYTHLKMEEGYH